MKKVLYGGKGLSKRAPQNMWKDRHYGGLGQPQMYIFTGLKWHQTIHVWSHGSGSGHFHLHQNQTRCSCGEQTFCDTWSVLVSITFGLRDKAGRREGTQPLLCFLHVELKQCIEGGIDLYKHRMFVILHLHQECGVAAVTGRSGIAGIHAPTQMAAAVERKSFMFTCRSSSLSSPTCVTEFNHRAVFAPQSPSVFTSQSNVIKVNIFFFIPRCLFILSGVHSLWLHWKWIVRVSHMKAWSPCMLCVP